MDRARKRERRDRRRAAVIVQVMVLMVVLLGFAALAIDVGNLYAVKAELQNAADAAAMAGVSAFADDSLRGGSFGDNEDVYAAAAGSEASLRTTTYALRNSTLGQAVALDQQDVLVGRFDFDDPSAPLDLTGMPNAVQVTTRRTADSPNGPVSNYFASIFGFHTTDLVASATAAFDDNFAAYTQPDQGPLIPFTVHEDIYNDLLVNGPDDFSYDPDLDVVLGFSDQISEVKLFPYAATDPPAGAGNFGLLNVGTPNQGVPALADQIENGITPEDIEAEVGTRELTFFDNTGNPVTYEITGSPGMDNGLIPSIEARVGQVVAFFIHTNVAASGSNATYTVAKIGFGRVMEVHLTGSPSGRQLVVQPVIFTDPGVRTDPAAPSSGGMVGRIVLVR